MERIELFRYFSVYSAKDPAAQWCSLSQTLESSAMKQTRQTREELLRQPRIFCTECQTELENFCLTGGAEDLEALKKTFAQCRKKGKFLGEFCSKLFIADGRTWEDLFDDIQPGNGEN
jgi:hypothetical protein